MSEMYPLLEFDGSGPALIEPSRLHRPIDIPPACVLAILPEAVTRLDRSGRARPIHHADTGIGKWPT